MPSMIDLIVEDARRNFVRVTATEAAAELERGALLVDIRTDRQREAQGCIPGAVAIDRTVLEWRLDPTSNWRIREASDLQKRVILICAEGYSSSLATESLLRVGLVNATDVIGGFESWKASGLAVGTEFQANPPGDDT